MSGAKRCDEIMRLIDEALEPFGGVVGNETKAASGESEKAGPEWSALVRWGALPQPVLASR